MFKSFAVQENGAGTTRKRDEDIELRKFDFLKWKMFSVKMPSVEK